MVGKAVDAMKKALWCVNASLEKKAIDLVANKAIKMDVLITDIFELPAYQQAYEKIEQSPEKTMKVLIRVQSENKRSELK